MPDIPIDRRELANGLRVVLSRDPSAPAVAVNLWYAVGSRHEQPGRTGFAHLFEHMMFQGSEHVAKGEHFALIQAVGGTLNASTWTDRTNYFDTVPSHELELALWLEADRLGGLLPAMTQEKLDNQRDVVKNERRLRYDNQPYGTWSERLQALAYPAGHPYHHSTIGSMDDLDSASLDDVREFFAAWYAPNNAVLIVAGDFEAAEAMALLDRHFGPIGANPSLPAAPDPALPVRIGEERREELVEAVPLPRIYLAYRIPPFGDDRFEDAAVVSDLLATGRASRLYASLVRERRLAQDAVAFALPWAAAPTLLALWATARPGVEAGALEEALLEELAKLAADGPSDDELERVRNLHRAEIESSLERVADRADRLSMYTQLFDDPSMINREAERYLAVDAGRVRATMAELLTDDNRVTLTYRPAGGNEAEADEAAVAAPAPAEATAGEAAAGETGR